MNGDDWIDIAPASAPQSDNVRRADAGHPLDFFRGRDFAGHYIFSLTADSGCEELARPPKLNGIDVTVEDRPPDGARLLLTLLERDQFDIFRALCDHLLKATADQPRGANAAGLRLVLRRLADWHELLRRRRDDLLSSSEVIGLVGELLFLRDQILPRAAPADAVTAWRGAHRDEQDFAIGQWQFEVKTQLSTADQRLIIASEAQLETSSSRLLLCHQCIAGSPTTAGSFTLNSLVEELMARLSDAGSPVTEAFEAALEAWGYARSEEYDHQSWLLTGRRAFEVVEGFPRLTPAMLPAGVQNVSYQILLRACQPFAVDLDLIMESVFP